MCLISFTRCRKQGGAQHSGGKAAGSRIPTDAAEPPLATALCHHLPSHGAGVLLPHVRTFPLHSEQLGCVCGNILATERFGNERNPQGMVRGPLPIQKGALFSLRPCPHSASAQHFPYSFPRWKSSFSIPCNLPKPMLMH